MMGVQLSDIRTVPLVPFRHACVDRKQRPCGCWPALNGYVHPTNGNNRAYRRTIRSLARRQQRRRLRERERATQWLTKWST